MPTNAYHSSPKTKANHNFTPIFITADKPPIHDGLSAAPSWFGGALLPHEIWGGSISILGVLLGALLYKLGKLRYPTASQDTKNTTTHTTTNMSSATLPTSGFGPLSP